MKQQATMQIRKKNRILPPSRLLSYTATRDKLHSPSQTAPNRPGLRFNHDFSQAVVRPTASLVGQNYATASCPVFPRRCPFGGACHTCPIRVQAKLKIGQPGDKYEQEADRVAEQIMRMPESTVRRQTNKGERTQIKPLVSPPVQTQENAGGEVEVSSGVTARVQALCRGGHPLSEKERNFFEPRFGQSFNDVRVHTGAAAAQIARAVNARAFTFGHNIVFGGGEYAPETRAGWQILAHELTHIVQNREAHLTPTIRRVCSAEIERRGRANSDPNEGQAAGGSQVPDFPCKWVLYGFDIGRSQFKVAFSLVVNQLAEFMRTNLGVRLRLEGFNDCFGNDADNEDLGNMRSLNVQNAFPSYLHHRITQLPTDSQTYLFSNVTPLYRSFNRSVRIEVIPPQHTPCPDELPMEHQLTPTVIGPCSPANHPFILRAARYAAPLAITVLSRVRNWRNNRNTVSSLDFFYGTTNDTERQTAADWVATMLERIIPSLQRQQFECLEPGHPYYQRYCTSPDGRIVFAVHATNDLVSVPTFCMPQFIDRLSESERTLTVLHEMAHRLPGRYGTLDYDDVQYEADCQPSAGVDALPQERLLRHTYTFECFFIRVLADEPPY